MTAEANLKSVQFLDVTLDLSDGSYKPYTKQNGQIKYVSVESNHPPNVLKNIPEGVNRRLENISSSKKEFDEEKHLFQEALDRAGYRHELTYREENSSDRGLSRRTRRRNVIWFNPPYSANIKTKIGKEFFKILRKHFPKGSKYYKLFNQNTVKLSYSCMPNMGSAIAGHNKRLLDDTPNSINRDHGCNCTGGVDECPLDGNCQIQEVVYRAVVSSNEDQKEYIGQTKNTFKSRYDGHTDSFRHIGRKKKTTLSKHIWSLKGHNKDFEIDWSIASVAKPYNRETKRCQLCNVEKTLILQQDPEKALNQRSELMIRCRHRDEHLLTNWVRKRTANGRRRQEDGGNDDDENEDDNETTRVETNVCASDDDINSIEGVTQDDPGGPMTRSRSRALNRR